mmetsp:Transcript_38113/g.96374  ORF Transcript_38113/g.96374 Transcript_38113/m.96374 type:complete len:105 (-) Transcript_38113:965-1279(-)
MLCSRLVVIDPWPWQRSMSDAAATAHGQIASSYKRKSASLILAAPPKSALVNTHGTCGTDIAQQCQAYISQRTMMVCQVPFTSGADTQDGRAPTPHSATCHEIP